MCPVWAYFTWAIVRREDQTRYKQLGDLRGETICWTRGSSYRDTLYNAGLNFGEASESADDDSALRMLLAGRCRAMLMSLDTGQPKKARAILGPRLDGLGLVAQPVERRYVHFAVGASSTWIKTIEQIDKVVGRHRKELERLQIQ